MQIDIKQIKKIFIHPKTFKKGGISTSPELFWQFILLVGFIIVLTSFVLGFFLFREVSKGAVYEVGNDAENSQAVSKDRLLKALEYFSGKEKKSEEILGSPSPVIDPSV